MRSRSLTNLIISLTSLCLGGFIILIGLPILHHIRTISQATQGIRNQIQTFDSRRAQVMTLAKDRDLNHTYATRLRSLLPETVDTDGLTLLIDSQRESLNLELPSLTIHEVTAAAPDAKPLPPGVSAINFALEVIGEYPQIITFIETLEHGDRFIIMQTLTLSGRDDGRVLAHLDGQAFTKPVTTTPSSAPVIIDPITRSAILARQAVPVPDLNLIPASRTDPFAAIQ